MKKGNGGKTSCKPELKVILYGVGSIGNSLANLLLKKKGIEIVGAIDSSTDKVGRDLGELVGFDKPLGVKVSNNLKKLLSTVEADIAVHATSSFLTSVRTQLVELIQNNVNIVSTCEELSYPKIIDKCFTSELDELAKEHGVTVLGTGVNPGFLMDTLAITLTGVCQEIKHIKVERVLDAAKRRIPFQKKIGAGFTTDAFREKIEKRLITGHVGLKQSVAMIADALGWNLQNVKLGNVEPVIAERYCESSYVKVERGMVAGLRQSALGIMEGKEVITLVFKAYIGVEEEYDAISIKGTPEIFEKITPCVHGDYGTAAIIVNSIPKVINAEPGLKTMRDLPIPSAILGDIRNFIK